MSAVWQPSDLDELQHALADARHPGVTVALQLARDGVREKVEQLRAKLIEDIKDSPTLSTDDLEFVWERPAPHWSDPYLYAASQAARLSADLRASAKTTGYISPAGMVYLNMIGNRLPLGATSPERIEATITKASEIRAAMSELLVELCEIRDTQSPHGGQDGHPTASQDVDRPDPSLCEPAAASASPAVSVAVAGAPTGFSPVDRRYRRFLLNQLPQTDAGDR